tara:strand:+ start:567 stop:1280 length:714 start_codon:yes stop_codon:yes gene_type:complete
LQSVGLKKGDTVFCHSNLIFFGRSKYNSNLLPKIFLECFMEVLGKKGTLAVPTFTYSFCNNQNFNPKKYKSICGVFAEYTKKSKQALIYEDPNLSVAVIGKYKKYLTKEPTVDAYGKDSFFDKFYNLKGKICNLNLDITSTFIHYFEKKLKVKYRFNKAFTGFMIKKQKKIYTKSILWVRYLRPSTKQNLDKLINIAKKKTKVSNLGRGFITSINLKDNFEIIKKNFTKDPKFLIKG